ncbi:substrate-binding periplasmic protein [Pseudomonas sp. BMS12]|uniref:substrate-binding periplasmic protein n=1 Tax=Pseudomonas sp. BMS12 TaxID=1796033 RepID=UPI00083B1974|nr:transporter substrate-binding domain-containing protein [Pseudomonas sp. BMS12]
MNRPRPRLWLLGLALSSSPLQAEEIVLASPSYWCPYSCTAGASEEGFTIDIIRWIFQRHGIAVRLVNENYSRALSDVRSGRYTASPSTIPEEAPDFVYPQEAVSSNRFCFYTRADSDWRYQGPQSLAGKTAGIIQGYAYGERLDAYIHEHGADFHKHTGNDLTRRLLRQLQLGRFDTFLEEENLVAYTLRLKPGNAPRMAGCEPRSLAYMAIAPDHPRAQAYADLFDEGMREMRASGALAEVLGRYGLSDWQASP